jgi:hypothetical protein
VVQKFLLVDFLFFCENVVGLFFIFAKVGVVILIPMLILILSSFL